MSFAHLDDNVGPHFLAEQRQVRPAHVVSIAKLMGVMMDRSSTTYNLILQKLLVASIIFSFHQQIHLSLHQQVQ